MSNANRLPRWLVTDIMTRAQLSPDAEICGLLAQGDNGELAHYPIENSSESPSNSFELDAAEHIDAQKSMRENNQTLLAIYHSHPTAPAVPSDRDYSGLSEPSALYLIISLNTKGVLEIGGWRINGQGWDAQELDMIEEERP